MSANTCSCRTNSSIDSLTGEDKIDSVCGCKSGNKSLKASNGFNIIGSGSIDEDSIFSNDCCGGNCSCSN